MKSGRDEWPVKLERFCRSVAGKWRKQVFVDPAHDYEDLVQELRLRCWLYLEDYEEEPHYSRVLDMARKTMRSWGYRGRHGSLLSCDRVKNEVSMSRNSTTREYDVTDEDILDAILFRHQPGWRGPSSDNQ